MLLPPRVSLRSVPQMGASEGGTGGVDPGCTSSRSLPGDELWCFIDEFTESVLDCAGELDRFDPEAAESRRFFESFFGRDQTADRRRPRD